MLKATFAAVFSPRRLASCQWRVARGPGPTTESEYSPTRPLHAAPLERLRPLADRHQPGVGRHPGDELRRIAVVRPAPVPADDLGGRGDAMHAVGDRRVDLPQDLGIGTLRAPRTVPGLAVRRAARQVLRRGDREHAAQPGHLPEDVTERVAQPSPHARVRGAHGDVVALADAGHLRRSRKNASGCARGSFMYRYTRDPVPLRPAHDPAEVLQPLLMVLAELREVRPPGRELAEHDVQPDPVHARPCQLLEQSVGIRVEPTVQQRVAEDPEVGIDVSQSLPASWPSGQDRPRPARADRRTRTAPRPALPVRGRTDAPPPP